MKRRLLILAVFLLAGAVVNVAVAWGIALSVNPYVSPTNTESHVEVQSTVLVVDERCEFGTVYFSCYPRRWSNQYLDMAKTPLGEYRTLDDALPQWASRHQVSTADLMNIVGRGWPFLTLSTSSTPRQSQGLPPQYRVSWGFETPLRPFTLQAVPLRFRNSFAWPRVVPLRPIWPGFAVNTLFYTTFLWLLILGPFVLRRLIRIRRGLCPACAYPRGESDVCSECGLGRQGRASESDE